MFILIDTAEARRKEDALACTIDWSNQTFSIACAIPTLPSHVELKRAARLGLRYRSSTAKKFFGANFGFMVDKEIPSIVLRAEYSFELELLGVDLAFETISVAAEFVIETLKELHFSELQMPVLHSLFTVSEMEYRRAHGRALDFHDMRRSSRFIKSSRMLTFAGRLICYAFAFYSIREQLDVLFLTYGMDGLDISWEPREHFGVRRPIYSNMFSPISKGWHYINYLQVFSRLMEIEPLFTPLQFRQYSVKLHSLLGKKRKAIARKDTIDPLRISYDRRSGIRIDKQLALDGLVHLVLHCPTDTLETLLGNSRLNEYVQLLQFGLVRSDSRAYLSSNTARMQKFITKLTSSTWIVQLITESLQQMDVVEIQWEGTEESTHVSCAYNDGQDSFVATATSESLEEALAEAEKQMIYTYFQV